jgi:hypothetical protein
MKIFFGAAIQGAHNREERAAVHRVIIDAIKSCDCEVISEHTTGGDYEATAQFWRRLWEPCPRKAWNGRC